MRVKFGGPWIFISAGMVLQSCSSFTTRLGLSTGKWYSSVLFSNVTSSNRLVSYVTLHHIIIIVTQYYFTEFMHIGNECTHRNKCIFACFIDPVIWFASGKCVISEIMLPAHQKSRYFPSELMKQEHCLSVHKTLASGSLVHKNPQRFTPHNKMALIFTWNLQPCNGEYNVIVLHCLHNNYEKHSIQI